MNDFKKNIEKVFELNEIVKNNKYVDKKVIEEARKLRDEARKFGHEVKSGYNLTPPLGNQILLTKREL